MGMFLVSDNNVTQVLHFCGMFTCSQSAIEGAIQRDMPKTSLFQSLLTDLWWTDTIDFRKWRERITPSPALNGFGIIFCYQNFSRYRYYGFFVLYIVTYLWFLGQWYFLLP